MCSTFTDGAVNGLRVKSWGGPGTAVGHAVILGGDPIHEWASNRETDTAMIRLTWKSAVTVDRVWLFGRPNTDYEHITDGMLVFSDGTTIRTGALPDDARRGLEFCFPPKTIRWLAFFVTETGPKTRNSGISEIAVFRKN